MTECEKVIHNELYKNEISPYWKICAENETHKIL